VQLAERGQREQRRRRFRSAGDVIVGSSDVIAAAKDDPRLLDRGVGRGAARRVPGGGVTSRLLDVVVVDSGSSAVVAVAPAPSPLGRLRAARWVPCEAAPAGIGS